MAPSVLPIKLFLIFKLIYFLKFMNLGYPVNFKNFFLEITSKQENRYILRFKFDETLADREKVFGNF